MMISTELLMRFIITILGGYVIMAGYVKNKLEKDSLEKQNEINNLKQELKEMRLYVSELNEKVINLTKSNCEMNKDTVELMRKVSNVMAKCTK
ncbi:MAG: hypothetical protein ACRC0V_06150 [Fusobacteriaceae bacterium]